MTQVKMTVLASACLCLPLAYLYSSTCLTHVWTSADTFVLFSLCTINLSHSHISATRPIRWRGEVNVMTGDVSTYKSQF